MSNLVNVYPLEVGRLLSRPSGVKINLVFRNGEVVQLFTPHQQNFIQLVDDIDNFCLNGTASRDLYPSQEVNKAENDPNCLGQRFPDHCEWVCFALTFVVLAYVTIFFLCAYAAGGSDFLENNESIVDRD